MEDDFQLRAANDNVAPSARSNLKLRLAARRRFDSPDQISRRVYDGNLKRVKSVINDGNGPKTIYNIYDAGGALVHIFKASENKRTDYVAGPAGTLARIANGHETYLHPDHLGSAQSGTDKTGKVVWREHYTPFGEQLQNPAANDNLDGFTGHIKDSATGLNYMQARYYDPVIGRFLSVDPVTLLDNGNPGNFNRYAYTLNDPINLIDPNGECSTDPDTPEPQQCKNPKDLDTSKEGKDAIADNENGPGNTAHLTVYPDSAGNPTVGTGYLVKPSDKLKMGETITQTEADNFFDSDISNAETDVENLLDGLPVSQQEFDALVDLTFNVGAKVLNAKNSPGLNTAIANADYAEIARNLVYSRDSSGRRQVGLAKRSQRRQNIFSSGNYARVP